LCSCFSKGVRIGGRRKEEGGRRKEEGRRKKEEGRRKKEGEELV
jgi:hypothetical protein